jgi:putative oxidoreductase
MNDNLQSDFLTPILNNSSLMGVVLLIARVFMAAVFLVFGIAKIVHNSNMREYMESQGVTSSLLPVAIVIEIAGGVLVALGYQTRIAAMILAGFCITATLLFHTRFEVIGELSNFTQDFAIGGGFLFMIAYGPGPLSLDARIARLKASKKEKAVDGRLLK